MRLGRCAALVAAAVLALPATASAARLQLVLPLQTNARGLTRFADGACDAETVSASKRRRRFRIDANDRGRKTMRQ